jgi:hypothetical protein
MAVKGAEGDLTTLKSWLNPEIEAEISGLKEGGEDSNFEEISFKQPFDPIGVHSLKWTESQGQFFVKNRLPDFS